MSESVAANLEAEEQVLGAILSWPPAVEQVKATGLSPGDFYRSHHGTIYGAALILLERSAGVDAITVAAELGEALSEVGGMDALSVLAAEVKAPGNAAEHARLIRAEATKRRKREIGHEVANGLAPDEAIRRLQALGAGQSDGARATAFAQVERESVKWLWAGRIPLGMLSLLIGDPGLGKSLLTVLLAAKVSRAGASALILSAEDHKAATIRPRLEAAGADLDRVHHVEVQRDGVEDGLALPDDAAELDRLVEETGARLVIVDPLMAHLPESVNSWRDQSVRRALAPLHRMAEERRCAVLVVAHLNKAKGADPQHRTGGSIAIPAAVRSALLLARDPEDPDGDRGAQRVLAHHKCNVGPQAESLTCTVESIVLEGGGGPEAPRLRITGTSEVSAGDLLSVPSGEERTERDEAADFLRAELEAGPQEANEILKAARKAGISETTLRRAKRSLGVESRRAGFGGQGHFEWVLANDGQGIDGPAYISDVAIYGENGSAPSIAESSEPIDGHGSDMATNGDQGSDQSAGWSEPEEGE